MSSGLEHFGSACPPTRMAFIGLALLPTHRVRMAAGQGPERPPAKPTTSVAKRLAGAEFPLGVEAFGAPRAAPAPRRCVMPAIRKRKRRGPARIRMIVSRADPGPVQNRQAPWPDRRHHTAGVNSVGVRQSAAARRSSCSRCATPTPPTSSRPCGSASTLAGRIRDAPRDGQPARGGRGGAVLQAAAPDEAGCRAPLIGDFHYNGHLLLTKSRSCARRWTSTGSTPATSAPASGATSSSPRSARWPSTTAKPCASASTAARSTRNS